MKIFTHFFFSLCPRQCVVRFRKEEQENKEIRQGKAKINAPRDGTGKGPAVGGHGNSKDTDVPNRNRGAKTNATSRGRGRPPKNARSAAENEGGGGPKGGCKETRGGEGRDPGATGSFAGGMIFTKKLIKDCF